MSSRSPSYSFFAGCDAVFGSDGASLTTDRDAYARSAVATLTLRNDGGETLSTSPLGCARLERRLDGEWTPAPEANGRFCAAVIVYVRPGDEQTALIVLEGATAGAYRFVQPTSVGDAVSGTFEVR